MVGIGVGGIESRGYIISLFCEIPMRFSKKIKNFQHVKRVIWVVSRVFMLE